MASAVRRCECFASRFPKHLRARYQSRRGLGTLCRLPIRLAAPTRHSSQRTTASPSTPKRSPRRTESTAFARRHLNPLRCRRQGLRGPPPRRRLSGPLRRLFALHPLLPLPSARGHKNRRGSGHRERSERRRCLRALRPNLHWGQRLRSHWRQKAPPPRHYKPHRQRG